MITTAAVAVCGIVRRAAALSPCAVRSLTGGVGGRDIDRIFVFWSPEACIADSMTDDGLSTVVSGNTQVSGGHRTHTDRWTGPLDNGVTSNSAAPSSLQKHHMPPRPGDVFVKLCFYCYTAP